MRTVPFVLLRLRTCFCPLALCLLSLAVTRLTAAEPSPALELFEKRIAPILAAKRPSSCSECHLSGVDLRQYIGANAGETFAALRAAGLVDVDKPRESKLLRLIARKPEKPSLVGEKARQEEYAAFAAWLEAAVTDPALAQVKADAKLGPELPGEVVRHARQDRVLERFIDGVWSEVGRCAACHSPDRNQKQVKEHGEQISWIKLRDPAATLAHLVEYELIDTRDPAKSLLLQKPTNQIKHGGGVKMAVGDRTYEQFRAFIEDYAAAKSGAYRTAKDLPAPQGEVSQATDIWFKLTKIPAAWDQKVLQADLFAWDDKTGAWTAQRVATGDRHINGKLGLWQQHLSVTAPRDSARAAAIAKDTTLPPGKYLVKVYVDREDHLAQKRPYRLGAAELVAEFELTSRWPSGYQAMTVAELPASK